MSAKYHILGNIFTCLIMKEEVCHAFLLTKLGILQVNFDDLKYTLITIIHTMNIRYS